MTTVEQADKIATVAAQLLDAAHGDRVKAANKLERQVRNDQTLRDELLEPLISSACWQAIAKAAHRQRRPYWGATAKTNRDNASGLHSVAVQHAQDWLQYPLSTGKCLGDATREDLYAEAAMHDKQARTNAVRAEFFRTIADRVKGNKPVRAVLNSAQLAALAEEISNV